MSEVDVAEATGRLGDLLDQVEAGQEVAITRYGKVVAKLVPAGPAFDREQASAAAERIREMRKGVTLGGIKIKDLIEEGRR